MTLNLPPQPFTNDQAVAWAGYLGETKDARERYGATLDHAAEEYEAVKRAADVLRDSVARDAWERYQRKAADAWQVYESDTQAARAAREWALGQNPLSLDQ